MARLLEMRIGVPFLILTWMGGMAQAADASVKVGGAAL